MRRVYLIGLLLCIVIVNSVAQKYNLEDPIPMDSATIKGVLPNGLTYFIRHNKEPKERASFYIIQNVGALLEKDNQNGLAHFLEHMAFNGTKHFPGKGIINTLEKHGVSFGGNINAYTSYDETVYNISDVPTNKPNLLDTCLLVLNDWSNYLLLTNKELDAERGVISEEWRTRRTSSFRLRNQIYKGLLKGSMWEKRDVIGDLNIIKNFKPKEIKEFYHDWYRTDLQAIAVVGDFDVKQMEQKIIQLFSKIPAVKNPKPKPEFTIPDNQKMIYTLATDKEASQSGISLYFKHKYVRKNNLLSLKNTYLESFFNSMIRNRISELLQKGIPNFINGRISFSKLVKGYKTLTISATAKPNMEAEAIDALYTEALRVKKYGFLQSELDRTKINFKASLESYLKKVSKIRNDSYCSTYKNCYINKINQADAKFTYEFGVYCVETITLDDINELAKKWITDTNRVLIITGPDKDVTHLTEQEAFDVIKKIENKDIKPYEDKLATNSLIEKPIKSGKIVSEKENKEFNSKEWILSNGAKVYYRFADLDKDNVYLSAVSNGGTSLYEIEDLIAANNLKNFNKAYGIGNFSAVDLKKVLTGKIVNVTPYLGALKEGIGGACSPKDFETMMQLVYLSFEQPRFDKEAHKALMSRNYAAIKNMVNNPQKIMQDSVNKIFSYYNPRVQLLNKEYLDKIKLEKIKRIYKERFCDASDFKFVIVGNIKEEIAKKMVEKYIGAIKDIDRKESWMDRTLKNKPNKIKKTLYFPMATPKGTSIIKFWKKAKYNAYNRLCQTVISNVLSLRYTENIREKEGGTYGVRVSPSVSKLPNQTLGLNISFSADPQKIEYLKTLVYKEIDLLVKKGPSQEDFNKVISKLKKNHEQGRDKNAYWFGVLKAYYFNNENYLDPDNFENIIKKLSIKDIRKAAKRFFKKNKLIDVLLLPEKDKIHV